MSKNVIPSSFPGYGDKKNAKPLPPKYLEVVNAEGKAETILNPAREEAEAKKNGAAKMKKNLANNPFSPVPLKILAGGKMAGSTPFVKTELSKVGPVKSYDGAPHRFKAAVDSRSEAKGVIANQHKMKQQLMDADYSNIHATGGRGSGSLHQGGNGGMVGFGGAHIGGNEGSQNLAPTGSGRGLPPSYVGSCYMNSTIPNAHKRLNVAPPKHPALPRPYVPESKRFFDEQHSLANRNTRGEILGQPAKTYVNYENVPYAEPAEQVVPENPVGPDNPVKALDESGIWSACWDDNAEAIYYYNNETGEATWIPPEI